MTCGRSVRFKTPSTAAVDQAEGIITVDEEFSMVEGSVLVAAGAWRREAAAVSELPLEGVAEKTV